ncbi:MAG TPA: hypothetical protein VM529_12525 [Gemmata sp.]|nr:hypothetical protein [Gemmata sp.]
MLPLLLLPLSVGSEPPAFEVTNRVPPFVVVNKVEPKPAAPTYADILARVRRGETVEFVAPLAGFPGEPGAYRAWPENGTPVMQRKGVAAPTAQPFRGLPFDADHTCDRCGNSQYVVERFLPNGRHVHTCRSCGNSWQH